MMKAPLEGEKPRRQAACYDDSMTGDVRVGTSGYHFKDWVGTVYPKGLAPDQFLTYYAQMFDCVEVNTSFYRIPCAKLFEGMLSRVPEGFLFVVKTPKEMTHQREAFAASIPPFVNSLRPLMEAGRLGALLAQFPHAFQPTVAAVAHLERLAGALVEHGIPVNVEFRHSGWQKGKVFERLRALGLGVVNADLPELPHLPRPACVVTSSVGYVRLHGRNAEMWWEHPTASHRYDYTYTEEELKGWTQRIERMQPGVDVVFAFTNNCRMGASIVDALRMKRLLGLDDFLPATASSADLFASEPEDPLDAMQARIDEARRLDEATVERWRADRADGG
jgi:uncharacterized protein YecE (DUF72 family)